MTRDDNTAACLILSAALIMFAVLVLSAVLPWLSWVVLILAEVCGTLG